MMALRVENALENMSRQFDRKASTDEGHKVYPTDQAQRKGLDRKDIEKFAHFQLTRQFEDLCCMPVDEMDDIDGNEVGSKRGGSPSKNMKDLSEQKQFENLGKNGRIYQFE